MGKTEGPDKTVSVGAALKESSGKGVVFPMKEHSLVSGSSIEI
jgi:hypothetical protein